MKTTLLFLVACVLLFSSNTFQKKNANNHTIPFKVYIEQDGIRIPVTNNEISLNKKTFDIVFVFDKPNAVLVNTSFNKSTYEMALKKEPLSKLPGYAGTGMAEGSFNTEKEVFIDDTCPSYWHYETSKENRFNKVVKTKDSIVCTRTIKQLNILGEKDNTILAIEKISKPLYFVFVDYETDPKTYERKEIQREMIKINWK